jgi:hypothetical protein
MCHILSASILLPGRRAFACFTEESTGKDEWFHGIHANDRASDAYESIDHVGFQVSDATFWLETNHADMDFIFAHLQPRSRIKVVFRRDHVFFMSKLFEKEIMKRQDTPICIQCSITIHKANPTLRK